jgi:hypothetical protein
MTHRALKVRRGVADRDPMFAPIWYDGSDMIATIARPEPAPPIELPPPSDLQQNDHVMRYWNWRLDRMEAKRG